MAVKRTNMWAVTLQFYSAFDGKELIRRKIAQSGLTAQSAANKVMAHYSTATSIKKLGKPTVVSITQYITK